MTQRSFGLETLDKWLQRRLLDVHVCMPCRVLKYDAAAQTVDVRPQISHIVENDEGELLPETLPDLYDVPVAFARGGGFHISFPLAADDFVLVVFSDEPTNSWREKAREVPPGLTDRHGLNGAFAMPCGYPDKQKLGTAPSTSALVFSSDNGSTVFSMDNAGTLTVTGDLVVSGEVTAGALVPAAQVNLTSHTHGSGVGPTSAPIPGT